MESRAGTTVASRYRQPWGKVLVFATVLTLVASMLGMLTSASSVLVADVDPAAHAELMVRGGDVAQDDTPLAGLNDVDNDSDDDDGGGDTIAPPSSLFRPLLGAPVRATAWLLTAFQSFVSGPSTPPPRV